MQRKKIVKKWKKKWRTTLDFISSTFVTCFTAIDTWKETKGHIYFWQFHEIKF